MANASKVTKDENVQNTSGKAIKRKLSAEEA